MKKYWQAAALVLAGAVSAVVFVHFLDGRRAMPVAEVAAVPNVEPMPMMAPVPDKPHGGTPLLDQLTPEAPAQEVPKPAVEPKRVAPKPAASPAPRVRRQPSPSMAKRPEPTTTMAAVVTQPPAPVQDQPAPVVQPTQDPGLAPIVTAPVEPTPAPAPVVPAAPRKVTIPAGTVLSVRLNEPVASDRNHTGDTFSAVLDSELIVDGLVIAERGARAEGRVVASRDAGRVKGVSAIVLEITEIMMSDGQRVRLDTDTFEKQGERSTRDDAVKVGVGAAIGAALGAIAGGGRGAGIGAAIGGATGAGGVLLSKGKSVTLPAETRLSFRVKNPVTVTERKS